MAEGSPPAASSAAVPGCDQAVARQYCQRFTKRKRFVNFLRLVPLWRRSLAFEHAPATPSHRLRTDRTASADLHVVCRVSSRGYRRAKPRPRCAGSFIRGVGDSSSGRNALFPAGAGSVRVRHRRREADRLRSHIARWRRTGRCRARQAGRLPARGGRLSPGARLHGDDSSGSPLRDCRAARRFEIGKRIERQSARESR
jgi:hypothetical protein